MLMLCVVKGGRSRIARHLGRDRKPIRAYLNGDRVPTSLLCSGPE